MAKVLESEPVEFLKSNGAAYLRVGATAIAAYDYLLTLPAEWRFYRSQTSWKLSPGCILFVILRYLSIAVITVSNVGYFKTFTREACLQYYMIAPILKPLQIIVCQAILGLRAYNISRRARWVFWSLLATFILFSAGEVFTNVFARIPIQNTHNNCVAANNQNKLVVWLFYVLAGVYDLLTVAISTYYLLDTVPSIRRMSGLVKLMFYDGIGYVIVLTAANVLNLILYRASDEEIQSSGATVSYVVTWIMAQRLLIHLRDAAAKMQGEGITAGTGTRTYSRELTAPRDISHAICTQMTRQETGGHVDEGCAMQIKSQTGKPQSHDRRHSGSTVSNSPEKSPSEFDEDTGLNVQVHVRHSVTVDYDPNAFERETYRKPRVFKNMTR